MKQPPKTMNSKRRNKAESPIDKRLKSLVAKITDSNRHDEIDWGRPVGKEILSKYEEASDK